MNDPCAPTAAALVLLASFAGTSSERVTVRASGSGEVITDVRIVGNQRTDEDTVLSIAGISIGDILKPTTLEVVRERLNSAGLFSDVNVFWEPKGRGVRITIVVKDKFPWAPVPTFSASKGNRSLGLVFVHGNLFGRGKQMLVGARLSNLDSGATLAYRDPSLFGSWLYWQVRGKFQDQVIPEFDPRDAAADRAIRETKIRSFGGEVFVGIAWFRRIKTQFGWHVEDFAVRGDPSFPEAGQSDGMAPWLPTVPAAAGARTGAMLADLIFDYRAREYAITTGNALDFGLLLANKTWQSEVDYWKASVRYEHYFRIGRRVNWSLLGAGNVGENLPLWEENWSGGDNLRGYLTRQFRGDTQARGTTELQFPLLPVIHTLSLELRGVVFYDTAAVWYRSLPSISMDPDTGLPVYATRAGKDARNFLPPDVLKPGFTVSENFHNAVGGGLRFFLRSVSVPLVGIDYGYGLESRRWRFFIVVGA